MISTQNNIKRYCVVVLLLFFLTSGKATAGAEEVTNYIIGTGVKTYQYYDLQGCYQTNSSSYKRCSIKYQMEALSGRLSEESYSVVNLQYDDLTVKLTELKATKATLEAYIAELTDATLITEANAQLATLNTQIEQYTTNSNSVKVSVADAKLTEELTDFYQTSEYLLTREAQNMVQNDFIKKCYGLILSKEQMEYNQAYDNYLKTVKTVETIKYMNGYANRTAMDTVDSNLLSNEMTLQKNKYIFDKDMLYICQETKIDSSSQISLKLSLEHKTYDFMNTKYQFIYSNASLKQLQNYIKSYQNYKSSIGAKSPTLVEQIDLKIQDYQLQEAELTTKIAGYVTDALIAYESAFRSCGAAKIDLSLKAKQLEIVIAKKEHKRATELDLRKAAYEKESAEVAYYQSCYNIIVWQNILDNQVYGATP